MKKMIVFLMFFFLSAICAYAGGGGVYPNGAEGFLVGAAPPPGIYGVSYTTYFNLPNLIDDDKDEIKAFDKGEVYGEILRFIWISDHKILGGNYGQHIFFPLLHKKLSFNAKVGPDKDDDYSDTNLPYIIWSPFLWTHHMLGGKLHMVLSLVDLYIPLNNQDDDNLATIGNNFWTFEPAFGVTYFYKNFEASLKVMYDINTKQDNYPTVYGVKVDRTPGNEFHFDYNVSYAINPKLRLGIGGFYYTQVTDDDYDLDNVHQPVKQFLKEDEHKYSRAFAVGPGIWFSFSKRLFVIMKYQQTLYERNYPEMRNFWLKVVYAF